MVAPGERRKDDMAKRLREPTLFILAALVSGRLHGYAILDAVEDLSDGRLRLTAGTLYGALGAARP